MNWNYIFFGKETISLIEWNGRRDELKLHNIDYIWTMVKNHLHNLRIIPGTFIRSKAPSFNTTCTWATQEIWQLTEITSSLAKWIKDKNRFQYRGCKWAYSESMTSSSFPRDLGSRTCKFEIDNQLSIRKGKCM